MRVQNEIAALGVGAQHGDEEKGNDEASRAPKYSGGLFASIAPAVPEGAPMVEFALDYARRGIHVFPLNPHNKRPFGNDWFGLSKEAQGGFHLATVDRETIIGWWKRAPRAMIGIRTGSQSRIWAVDPDVPKKPTDPNGVIAWRELVKEHGPIAPTHAHSTPRGGYHLVFAWDDARPQTNSAGGLPAGIDVRGEGGYIVGPPSVMTNGRTYEHVAPANAFDFAPAPDWLYELLAKKPAPARKERPEKPEAKPGKSETFFGKVNRAALDEPEAWVFELFPTAEHQSGTGAYRVASADLGRDLEEDLSIHNSGIRDFGTEEPKSPIDLVMEHGGAPDAKAAALWLCEKLEIDPAGLGFGQRRRIMRKEPTGWLADCLTNRDGDPLSTLANVLLALRCDPAIKECFAYDMMLCRVMLVAPLPGRQTEPKRPVTDNDIGRLQEWLQLAGLRRVNTDTVHQAVSIRAEDSQWHPVRNFLDEAKWDGVKRLDRWMTTHLGVAESAYTTAIGRMFLIAMVARIYRPGCKSDHMVVLEGGQGLLKSSACAVLAGEWFSETLPDITGGKDALAHLAGKWLIEIAEMSALSKAENNALKAFISGSVDRFRPSYGRSEVDQRRQCLFVGTTNKSTYLKDETGGRRFWPVKVGKIDLDALRRDRTQLFAEAIAAFKAGAPWWPDKDFEKTHIAPQQEERFEVDAWEEAIAAYLADKEDQQFTAIQVAKGALFVETQRLGTRDQNRVTNALQRLGWVRQAKDWKGNRPWGRP